MTILQKFLRHLQVWDWDLASANDEIGETSFDIGNCRFSSQRATQEENYGPP